MEVYVLSNRLRNIKQSFKTTHNKGLKERLFSENNLSFNDLFSVVLKDCFIFLSLLDNTSTSINKLLVSDCDSFMFYSGDVSMKEGATLTVWLPIGAINNSDDLNLEINLVDVTRVEPINSPILS